MVPNRKVTGLHRKEDYTMRPWLHPSAGTLDERRVLFHDPSHSNVDPQRKPKLARSMLTPFRSAAFGRLWSSSLAAAGAQGMERTTTAWLALQTGGGAFAIGLVFAARSLP